MTPRKPRSTANAAPWVEEVNKLRAEVEALRSERVRFIEAPVTAVDAGLETFTVDIPGQADGANVELAGIAPAAGQFMPDVGQIVRLALTGAQMVHQPSGIAENAITSREVADGAIAQEQLAFDLNSIIGQQIFYGPDTPTDPHLGDLWLHELTPPVGPINATYEPLRRIEGGWQVLTDSKAADGLLAAVAAQLDADAAADLAAGRLQQFVQDTEPAALGATEKGTWTDTNDGNRQYTWSGSAWISRRLGNGAITPNSLIASELFVTGSVNAALLESTLVLSTTIIAGNPNGTHVRITPTGLRVFRIDPSSGLLDEVIRLGTDTDDYFAIIDALGKLTASIDLNGIAAFNGLSVTGDPRFQGELLSVLLGAKAQIVAWTSFWSATGPTTDEIGMIEIGFQAKPGHAYALHATGLIPDASGGGDDHIVVFRIRATFDGSAPNVSSSYIMGSGQGRTRYDLSPWENPVVNVHGMHFESATGAGSTVRALLTIVRPPTATYADIYTDNTISRRYFWAEDLGKTPGDTGQINTGGGTRSAGQPPTPPVPPNAKVDGESIFNATWVSNFRGNLSYVDFAEAYQGSDQGSGGNGNLRSFIGFPDIASALAGGALRYIRVWLWYGHWWNNSGGLPVIGWHSNLNKVTTAVGQDAAVITGPLIPRAAGAWIDLPVSWGNAFLAGTARGIALGPGPTTGAQYYGRANGPGQANAPKIAIGWTK